MLYIVDPSGVSATLPLVIFTILSQSSAFRFNESRVKAIADRGFHDGD